MRLISFQNQFKSCFISTHTPHTGCDPHRLPCYNVDIISTHTPHTGCDFSENGWAMVFKNFNSHTPHGVRRSRAIISSKQSTDFNSHTPHGVRRQKVYEIIIRHVISTHTPHTGCDSLSVMGLSDLKNFNSHTPHGVRLIVSAEEKNYREISTHTPHTGCDKARFHS